MIGEEGGATGSQEIAERRECLDMAALAASPTWTEPPDCSQQRGRTWTGHGICG
jgi:hypothetical protein